VATLLEQAREAFTARDHERAERLAGAALDADPTRPQGAEARMIAAECAHARGALDEALRRYQEVAAQFADLAAGETALFSAARLEISRGHVDAAQKLFERYLQRFPSGRFVDDAKRELGRSR
jgi:TolA-binding protein